MSDSGSAMDASAPPSRAASVRPESPAMATTHSVNSLVETAMSGQSGMAPTTQPPGFLGPRVVRKRDRWSDGESDSMAPPAKRPEPDAVSELGAPSELGGVSAEDEAPPAPEAQDEATAETERYVRLALAAHVRSAPPKRPEPRPPSPRREPRRPDESRQLVRQDDSARQVARSESSGGKKPVLSGMHNYHEQLAAARARGVGRGGPRGLGGSSQRPPARQDLTNSRGDAPRGSLPRGYQPRGTFQRGGGPPRGPYGGNYGPPPGQYPPRGQYGGGNYGPPPGQYPPQYGAPPGQYGGGNYGPPPGQYGAPPQQPPGQYGAPPAQPGGNYGPPPGQYGAPLPGQYGGAPPAQR